MATPQAAPPLLWILGVQIVGTLADTLLSRTFRVEFSGSPRRSLIASTIVAAVVTTVGVLLLEFGLPLKYSADCMTQDRGLVPCCGSSYPLALDGSVCAAGAGAPQGVTNVLRLLYEHPWLLLNGFSAVVYACATVILLSHSIGSILKVNATMFSTFLIAPLLKIFNPESSVKGIPLVIVVAAAFGATLSSITLPQLYWLLAFPWRLLQKLCPSCRCDENQQFQGVDQEEGEETVEGAADRWRRTAKKAAVVGNAMGAFRAPFKIHTNARFAVGGPPPPLPPQLSRRASMGIEASLAATGAGSLSLAFFLLAVSMAFWTVMQRYSQDICGVNHLGFVTLDQVASAPYILLYTALVSVPPLRGPMLWEADRLAGETLTESFTHTWREAIRNRGTGMLLLVASRMLMCAAIAGGFLIVVMFNPAIAVMQMSVVRLLVSWVSTTTIILLCPGWLRISSEEKAEALDFTNLLLKLVGSIVLVCVLYVVNSSG